jgi:hypothetical protein
VLPTLQRVICLCLIFVGFHLKSRLASKSESSHKTSRMNIPVIAVK